MADVPAAEADAPDDGAPDPEAEPAFTASVPLVCSDGAAESAQAPKQTEDIRNRNAEKRMSLRLQVNQSWRERYVIVQLTATLDRQKLFHKQAAARGFAPRQLDQSKVSARHARS
jgi:hypothetical protein